MGNIFSEKHIFLKSCYTAVINIYIDIYIYQYINILESQGQFLPIVLSHLHSYLAYYVGNKNKQTNKHKKLEEVYGCLCFPHSK